MAKSKTLFSADPHIGDERQALMQRPFKTATEAAQAYAINWNNRVMRNDIVYMIGDFAIDSTWLQWAEALNGEKVLIKGNLDTLRDDEYEKYFNYVTDGSMILSEKNPDTGEFVKFNLVHYPGKSIPEAWNLVGHIHDRWKVQKNMINIGVDCWHFSPVSLDEIFFITKAIETFYDQDVWVADHPANTAHAERGRAGTYWESGYVGTRTEPK